MPPPKGSFANQYEDFNSVASSYILNDTRNGLSEKFVNKLHTFKAEKLDLLHTKMEKDIFYDGTVYTGSAGLALYYLMSPYKKEVPVQNLLTAVNYLKLDELKHKRISFLCGDAGPLAIAAVISYKLKDKRPDILPDYKTLIQRLMSLISLLDESPNEVLYGKAGYLYALLFVNKYITGKDGVPANHVQKVTAAIIRSGKELSTKIKSSSPLLWEWHDKIYFGAAHGMAGILYMLLKARAYISTTELRSFIKPTVDWLLEHQFPSGNFPSSMGSSNGDKLVQWCHGAPGFVPLCILAAKIFEKEKYMNIAFQCGDVTWERGLSAKGYSLCHGVSGNAYTFLQLYQATKKPVYLYRACCFMEWCAIERSGTELYQPDRPASLFEGLVGRLYLADDIKRPLHSLFPAFCL